MLDNHPVIDAVVHPFNFAPSNYANSFGEMFAKMVAGGAAVSAPPAYCLPASAYVRDWSPEEVARVVFLESHTDLAVYHVLPLNAFKDGSCSVEKGLELRRKFPGRFFFYIGVDPLDAGCLDELDRQYELFEGDVVGVKLYPNSWVTGDIRGWHMNDPRVAYPVFEKAQQLGVNSVAIHKALPLGPAEIVHYRVDDIDRASMDFPDLNFEIVHGGSAFVEETAFQLRRFPNVYVNLESTTILASMRPAVWQRVMAAFINSPLAAQKVLWASGCFVAHPQPALEAFRRFRFGEEFMAEEGVRQITDEDKANILGGNFARLHGIDLAARLEAVSDDAIARERASMNALGAPYAAQREQLVAS
jgi:predicted TIM-barrel fold metal-dependent hydrolase